MTHVGRRHLGGRVAGLLARAGGGRLWERAHRPTTREV